MAAPCALIASCTDTNPQDIVKQILSADELPAADPVLEEVVSYPWHVNTKYYTADVRICTTHTRTIGDEQFANSVQALILLFDSKQESSFEQVNSWLPFAKELDAPVEMLVCKRCEPEDVIPRSRVQTWCLKHSFELVELDPETFSDEEEDDFPETTGVKRIIQSLHAHMWPNLVMKDSPTFRSPYMDQMMATEAENKRVQTGTSSGEEPTPTTGDQEAAAARRLEEEDKDQGSGQEEAPAAKGGDAQGATSHDSQEQRSGEDGDGLVRADTAGEGGATISHKPSKEEKNLANAKEAEQEAIDSLINNDDIALFSSLGNEDAPEESFEQLFEKMQLMKQRAENLPPEQRRAYAEKVAITFWKAIGGDEEEIEGLSDDDR